MNVQSFMHLLRCHDGATERLTNKAYNEPQTLEEVNRMYETGVEILRSKFHPSVNVTLIDGSHCTILSGGRAFTQIMRLVKGDGSVSETVEQPNQANVYGNLESKLRKIREFQNQQMQAQPAREDSVASERLRYKLHKIREWELQQMHLSIDTGRGDIVPGVSPTMDDIIQDKLAKIHAFKQQHQIRPDVSDPTVEEFVKYKLEKIKQFERRQLPQEETESVPPTPRDQLIEEKVRKIKAYEQQRMRDEVDRIRKNKSKRTPQKTVDIWQDVETPQVKTKTSLPIMKLIIIVLVCLVGAAVILAYYLCVYRKISKKSERRRHHYNADQMHNRQ